MSQDINRLFHVCITVPEIEEALKFYCGTLGLHSIGCLRNEKADGKVLGFPAGEEIEINADHLCGKLTENATVIDLIEYIKPKSFIGDGPYKEMNRVGITRMAFGVDNTDEIYEKLRQRDDVDIVSEPMTVNAPGGGWLKIMTFKDPYGIVLEVIESHGPATE